MKRRCVWLVLFILMFEKVLECLTLATPKMILAASRLAPCRLHSILPNVNIPSIHNLIRGLSHIRSV